MSVVSIVQNACCFHQVSIQVSSIATTSFASDDRFLNFAHHRKLIIHPSAPCRHFPHTWNYSAYWIHALPLENRGSHAHQFVIDGFDRILPNVAVDDGDQFLRHHMADEDMQASIPHRWTSVGTDRPRAAARFPSRNLASCGECCVSKQNKQQRYKSNSTPTRGIPPNLLEE